MKYFIAIYVWFFISISAFGALTETDRQEFVFKNILKEKNPGFENSKSGWTIVTDTFSIDTSAPLTGNGSAVWDSAGTGRTLTSSAITIPAGLKGRNGLAQCKIVVASGTATHTLEVYDGSNTLASATITSSTTPTYTPVNFIFPSSGTVAIRLSSVAADEPSIEIDDCYIGEATNLTNVSQSEVYGTASSVGAPNCTWTSNSGSYAVFSADTDCSAATVTGNASAPATKIPAIKFTTLPPGNYQVEFTGRFRTAPSSSGTASCEWQIYDGTNQIAGIGVAQAVTTYENSIGAVKGFISYTTPQSNLQFEIRAKLSSGNGTCDISNSTTDRKFEIIVTRFPTSSQISVLPEMTSWRIDANIAGANLSLGTTSQSSYVAPNDAGLTLTQNTGSASVGISCSSTNENSVGSTTCSAGSEEIGVVFNLPRAGTVKCTAEFAHSARGAATTDDVNETFELVHTPNNAQTLTEEGKSRIPSGFDNAATTTFNAYNPVSVSGIFNFTSAGKKTVRLMHESVINGTPTFNRIYIDADATAGQRDAHIYCNYIDQQASNPVILNQVSNSSSSGVKAEAARINCDASGSITSQVGSWVSSVGNISAGACTITLISGTFSATPYCVVNEVNVGNNNTWSLSAASATSLTVHCESDAGVDCAVGGDAWVICIGAK